MKKYITVLGIALLLSVKGNCQLEKGNWLVGGNASFSSLQSSSTAIAQYSKLTNFQISPTLGYFIKDKCVVGLRPSLSYTSNNSGYSGTITSIGPFTRYYLLDPEKIFNILLEGSYAHGSINGKGQGEAIQLNTFSFSCGPVLYFNSSVGLEFILSYNSTKYPNFSGANNEIRFGIGFQFHLISKNNINEN